MAGERTLPGLGLKAGWTIGSNGYGPDMEANFRSVSALLQGAVKSRSANLPGTPATGDIYLMKSTDGTNPNKVAVWDTPVGGSAQWIYLTPKAGWTLYVADESAFVTYTGTAWQRIDESSTHQTRLIAAIDAALGGTTWKNSAAPVPLVQTVKTASYSLVNADFFGDKVIRMNAATSTVVTIPTGLTNVQPLTIIRKGDGAVTVGAAAGVTINSADGRLGLRSKFSSATLIPEGGNAYNLIGDLT
jgi:hypothetical protein